MKTPNGKKKSQKAKEYGYRKKYQFNQERDATSPKANQAASINEERASKYWKMNQFKKKKEGRDNVFNIKVDFVLFLL